MFQVALWLGYPAFNLHLVVTRLEGNDTNSVPTNGISAFIVSFPNFNLEFRPTSYCLTLIVQIERVIPHSILIYIISHFFIGFTLILPIYKCPILPALNSKLAKRSLSAEASGTLNLTNQMHLRSLRKLGHFLI